ncbi:hypothetical protein FAM09_03920 [Niastella caeni]|uniref:Uncharacterized protein n=1 Tax=Niastella caeni TaxID=2569763 RepID=A0A4S8I076_9BACT|nr:hypothetical protein [Niastella caeni]THU41265.1 hypothetical protein FAM09_03920 [Niastella caeni]
MQFVTYIIEGNPDKSVDVAAKIVAGLIAGVFIACLTGFATIAAYLFLIMAVGGIIFAFVKKGNIQSHGLSKSQLLISTSSVQIAGDVYEMGKIKDLQFRIHSYAGLDYMADGLKTSDGMNNYVSFTVDEKKINCRFYLDGPTHTLTLCKLFQEFYYKRIPFIEIDRDGIQTYLLQRFDDKELAAFKNKYGY